jgi:hypothetical protein
MHMLRYALAVLCPRAQRAYGTASIRMGIAGNCCDLSNICPRRKWGNYSQMGLVTPFIALLIFSISICQSVVHLLSPTQVISHNSITWLVYIVYFSQQWDLCSWRRCLLL